MPSSLLEEAVAWIEPVEANPLTYREWIGGSFDPAAFDVDEANKRLSPSEHRASRTVVVGPLTMKQPSRQKRRERR